MRPDLRDALADRGIRLLRYAVGEHRARCRECAQPPERHDDALAVKIDPDGGATWICHRCNWTGGIGQTAAQSGYAGAGRARTRLGTLLPGGGIQERRSEGVLEPERHDTLSDWGRTLWDVSQPIELDTIAGRYLEGRGCALPSFPDKTHLRWNPALCDRVSGYTGPALVALVTDVETGEAISLHRTWLAADGSGKAEIDKPRRLLPGHRSRGVVRLWPDAESTMGLVIGEGIETCLAAARAGLTPCWSTLSAGNLAAFPALPGVEGLTVLVDHDRPNPRTGKCAGDAAARELIARYVAAGFDPAREIRIIRPPTEGEDAADLFASAA